MADVEFQVMTPEEVAALSVPAGAVRGDPASRERLRDVLRTHGVAVVTGVLDEKECLEMEQMWKADLASVVDKEAAVATAAGRKALRELNAKSRGGPANFKGWAPECSEAIGTAKRGFATSRGLPHGEFAWRSRLHPEVRAAFAAVFDTEPGEMAVGVDNTMWAGPDSPGCSTNNEWLHVDQNTNTGLLWQCYQGVLYVWGSESRRSSTTVVWPGSHRPEIYDSIIMTDEHAKHKGKNWFGQLIKLNLLKSEEGKALHARAVSEARRIPMPPGSLLLWDSRLTHQGWSGGPRLAQPICWEPKERRGEDALRRKLWMCATGSPSSHSSTEGRVHPLAPKTPRLKFVGGGAEGSYALPLTSTIVPYGVRPNAVEEWRGMQEALWCSKGHDKADKADGDAIRAILRDEVADAL